MQHVYESYGSTSQKGNLPIAIDVLIDEIWRDASQYLSTETGVDVGSTLVRSVTGLTAAVARKKVSFVGSL